MNGGMQMASQEDFAGGERGLQQFVKDGDLTFAQEDASA